MKCDACGVESDFDAGFVQQRRSFSNKKGRLCPSCWAKRQHRNGLKVLFTIPALAVGGYVLKLIAPGDFIGEFLFNFALIQVFLITTIIPHELGHAVTGWALGWSVKQITIGVGKQIWKGRWKETLLDLRLIPVGGATFLYPRETSHLRLKFFLSILAGPLVNAVMGCVVVLSFGGTLFPLNLEPLPEAARLFVCANAIVLLVNLWPRQSKGGMLLSTDGKLLLQLLALKGKALEEIRTMRFVYEAGICREQGDIGGARAWFERGLALYPNDKHLLTFSGLAHLDDQNYGAARDVFLKLLQAEKPGSQLRLIMMNNVAYADALSGVPELLPEADAYSRDAYAMLPWMAAIEGTRGAVLVALGNYQEGIRLLKKSLGDADCPRNKCENACVLVIAYAKMRQPEDARKYLELAKQFDPKCPLLERAEQALEETNVRAVLPAASSRA